jgi:hypothetical protein
MRSKALPHPAGSEGHPKKRCQSTYDGNLKSDTTRRKEITYSNLQPILFLFRPDLVDGVAFVVDAVLHDIADLGVVLDIYFRRPPSPAPALTFRRANLDVWLQVSVYTRVLTYIRV